LKGPHNASNAVAAINVASALGVENADIDRALRTFRGLPHRMELVRAREGILFVNDSKATNPEAAAPALAAFPYIHWIVGGLAKSEGLGPCANQLGHVRAAYTIGESGPMFAHLLEGKVPVLECELLVTAVGEAAQAAAPGEVVLLSPACASFDQFRDYEARGDAFRAAVEALP
jgi:UDP-N-acetylmuramoylalanine--D-glutamate ligase